MQFDDGIGCWIRSRGATTMIRDGIGLAAPMKIVGQVPVWFETKHASQYEMDRDVCVVGKQVPSKSEREKLWKEALAAQKARQAEIERKAELMAEMRKKKKAASKGTKEAEVITPAGRVRVSE